MGAATWRMQRERQHAAEARWEMDEPAAPAADETAQVVDTGADDPDPAPVRAAGRKGRATRD